MTYTDLMVEYKFRFGAYYQKIAINLESHLKDILKDLPRIDKISARPKSIDRFEKKALKIDDFGKQKYSNPLSQIQDQVGARIVCHYLADVEAICKRVSDFFSNIESRDIVPDSPNEFGYEGKHFILFLPEDVYTADVDKTRVPIFFELQVKTLFQHAWAEAGHDLAYKPGKILSFDEKRKIAFTAAQSWGADKIFDELFSASQS